MIERYTRPEMGKVWTIESRFSQMKEVELAVAQAQSEKGIIPTEAFVAMKDKASFSVERINELEKETRHDVIAFVSNLAENVGEYGRYIHYGLTSSDVLDTALSLQIAQAEKVIADSLNRLKTALTDQIHLHRETLCAGRTHGMHAEPTSFGLKLTNHLAELVRNENRLRRAFKQAQRGKLSGAVGTYSALAPEVERRACEILNLEVETIATQVIPRDRHAELMAALAFIGNGLERLAIEIRHLQRTEVGEALEGFSRGQKGSSAMPHKKNPIGSENLTGVARLLRSYAHAAMENVALWHERDISHSSVERVAFPDAMILADYGLDRMANIIRDLQVVPERMLANMELSQGQLYSSHLLLALVEKGLTREEAYKMAQKASHELPTGQSLHSFVKSDSSWKEYLSDSEIDDIFSGKKHRAAISRLVANVLEELKS